MSAASEAGRDAFDQAFDQILKESLNSDIIPPDNLQLTDVGISSFQMVKLMMNLEDEFDSMWPLDYLVAPPQITTLGQLRRLTKDLLRKNGR